MSFHDTFTNVDIHTPFRAVYADSTARIAESGFSAGDVHKVALQQSDNTLWLVTSVTSGVPAWTEVGGSSSGVSSVNTRTGAVTLGGQRHTQLRGERLRPHTGCRARSWRHERHNQIPA